MILPVILRGSIDRLRSFYISIKIRQMFEARNLENFPNKIKARISYKSRKIFNKREIYVISCSQNGRNGRRGQAYV